MNKIKETYFVRTPARLLEEIRLMAPIIATLVDLTATFSEQFRLAKLERGIIDFSDLEHYALQILTVEIDGELQPSPVALDMKNVLKKYLWMNIRIRICYRKPFYSLSKQVKRGMATCLWLET